MKPTMTRRKMLVSLHHKNTMKIADEIVKVLNAQIKTSQQIIIEYLPKHQQ